MQQKPYNILVVFPHGIGDAVMATPSFRALQKKHPQARIDVAVRAIVRDSGFLDNCGYFNNLYTIDNPWCSRHYKEGIKVVRSQVKQLIEFNRYKEVKWVYHCQEKDEIIHKVFLTAKELDIDLGEDTGYEVFISEPEERLALLWLQKQGYKPGGYAFVHISSSDSKKNISFSTANKLIPDCYRNSLIVIGQSFDILQYPIGFAITLLKNAGFTLLVDSVFVHCSDALNKHIDVHITNPTIMRTNKPLHIKAHKTIKREFTKSRRVRHRLQRAYYSIRPGLQAGYRSRRYRKALKAIAGKPAAADWITKSVTSLQYSNPTGVYMIGLRVKVLTYQHLFANTYVCYLQRNGGNYNVLEFEPVEPLPLKGIEIFRSYGVADDGSIKATIDTIRNSINQLTDRSCNLKYVWLARYDIEKAKIVESHVVDDGPICSIAQRQQPFISDEDVKTFFRALFSCLLS